MPATPGQDVYKVTSDKNRARLRRLIATFKASVKQHRAGGHNDDATVCRLTAVGLEAVLEAGDEGIDSFGIEHILRDACIPGDSTPHSTALAFVKKKTLELVG